MTPPGDAGAWAIYPTRRGLRLEDARRIDGGQPSCRDIGGNKGHHDGRRATKDILPAGKQHKLGDKVRRERADRNVRPTPTMKPITAVAALCCSTRRYRSLFLNPSAFRMPYSCAFLDRRCVNHVHYRQPNDERQPEDNEQYRNDVANDSVACIRRKVLRVCATIGVSLSAARVSMSSSGLRILPFPDRDHVEGGGPGHTKRLLLVVSDKYRLRYHKVAAFDTPTTVQSSRPARKTSPTRCRSDRSAFRQ